MENRNHQSAVLRPSAGRKIIVLGQEIAVKLSISETGGDYYLLEGVTAPGDRVPPHLHSREDEILQVMEGELEVLLPGRTCKTPRG